MALKPMSTLPEPMISVTSESRFVSVERVELGDKGGRTRRVVRFKQSDFDSFIGEEAHFLSEVDGGMVWRCVPSLLQLPSLTIPSSMLTSSSRK